MQIQEIERNIAKMEEEIIQLDARILNNPSDAEINQLGAQVLALDQTLSTYKRTLSFAQTLSPKVEELKRKLNKL